jgi:hypothetical protein
VKKGNTMIRVSEHFRELYTEFREQFGRMVDNLHYRLACVNNTLKVTHLEHVSIESIMWQAYSAGANQARSLQDQVDGLRALCEKNDIEIPEERELTRLGRQGRKDASN